MEQISALVWKTERPLIEAPRHTPNFWLLGYEWKFSLYANNNYSKTIRYDLFLCQPHDKRPLDKPLTVTVYIRSTVPAFGSSVYETTSSCYAERFVWSREVKSVDTVLGSEILQGKWTITCIFHSDQPLRLHLPKNETELSDSQDKCVQACYDIPPDLESLSGDFSQLLEREIFPDVKLRCGDRTISAHRSILSARSVVFTAMFRNKMAESETGTVDVTDVDSEVLDFLLQYAYSGKIPDLSEDTACGLYEAGDKYSIHALKKSCSDWMVRNLTAENCLDYLLVADAHSDEDFKDRVVDFAAKYLESIKKGDWTLFKKDHPLLAISVYERHLAPTLSKQA